MVETLTCLAAVAAVSPAATVWLRNWKERLPAGSLQYRPAQIQLAKTRIPQVLLQCGANLNDTNAYQESFRVLNPEYEYMLWIEADAISFIDAVGSEQERYAYASIVAGANKGDMLRLIFLREVGGVFAETDTRLTKPLREVLAADASGVVVRGWDFDLLAFEAHHPLIIAAIANGTRLVFWQLALLREGSRSRCRGPTACGIRIIGPTMYRRNAATSARALGCHVPVGRLPNVPIDCRESFSEPMRTLRVCEACKDENVYAHLSCNRRDRIAGSTLLPRTCGRDHYSQFQKKRREFFRIPPWNLSRGLEVVSEAQIRGL
mmetsp:Transcript_41182/g.68489  ORF Transcript_41182/g.68489 Transcript_41182/m.68489 type:complete len:320 (-) Transcript_41182:180-1139(-)|eukprot:CAMPEP_0119325294 /NCGR_PEP_ID=MMETSP1333-20130426/65451_1 /TAXON_ID=418940 /ORGANISM="Scyphosphaera apsteinii, Strain RCC1455" /LENGTH=319 /DNA_ID=CAMNT_0007333247 /DNA_START=136 /DNA_END=1095 /DNA_ORIENTATION=-